MTTYDRFMVIKTGWCDSYTGDPSFGNFAFLEKGGAGAERFNMTPTERGFLVYCLPPAPQPVKRSGWTIAHVARDPAERKLKLVGWYEDATFQPDYADRFPNPGDTGSIYCIIADRAFEIAPAERPIVAHNHKLGTTRLGWLRGEATSTDWTRTARRLKKLIESHKSKAVDARRPNDSRERLGDTRRSLQRSTDYQIDDGGEVYGRGGESEEHKRLKRWAFDHPELFVGSVSDISSIEEFDLPSGDKIDAVHIVGGATGTLWLIEVKSRRSGEKDKERGIFQCIKYRAVAEAMQKGERDKRPVRVVLLTEDGLSERLIALAGRHGVRHLTHHCGTA